MLEERNAELEAALAAVEETKGKMEPYFTELGRALYPTAQLSAPPEARAPLEALAALEDELAARMDACDKLRGYVTCPACGADVPYGSRFCNYCGIRLEQEKPAAPAPQPEPEPVPEVPQVQHCIYCGKELEPGDKFCMFCGRAQ